MLIDVTRPTFGFSCWSGDPGPMTVAHRHDDIEINVADHELDYVLNGVLLTIPAGRAGIFWASRPHQLVEVAVGTRVIWLTVPLHDFLSWNLPVPFVAALLQGELVVPDVLPRAVGGDFSRWQADLASGSGFAADTSRLEVHAFLRRLSTTPDAARVTSPRASSGGALESVATMAAFIATHFAEPITVATVSDSAHVQPSYAMALFKRVVGISIGAYLAQCRVAEAQRLLIATRLSGDDIAPAAGFGSTSQFYERFRAACGMTPAAYRRQNTLREGIVDAAASRLRASSNDSDASRVRS